MAQPFCAPRFSSRWLLRRRVGNNGILLEVRPHEIRGRIGEFDFARAIQRKGHVRGRCGVAGFLLNGLALFI
jgi:hypothetical protein